MTVNRTTLLDLPLPVTGTESNTWGDITNNGLTEYVDVAIAGTLVLSTDADVTLTSTEGDSSATNIGATTAQYAILRWTATGSTTRNITALAQSKTYVVINATGGTQSIVLRGAGPTTGVTIVAGEKAYCAWNGSDFVKVGGAAGGSTTQVQYNNAGVFGGITNATSDGTTLSMTSPKVITSINDTNGNELLKVTATGSAVNEVTVANAATGNNPVLSATGNDTNIGINLTPKGSGAIKLSGLSYPTADGSANQAIVTNGSGTLSFATISTSAATPTTLGTVYGSMTTSGASPYLTALGYNAGASTTGAGNTAVGVSALLANISGISNTVVGYQAASTFTTSNSVTAVGYQAGASCTGDSWTAVGSQAMQNATTGSENQAFGNRALRAVTSGSYNTAIGKEALLANTTGSSSTAVGYQALYTNTTGTTNAAFGDSALYSNTTGYDNTAVGVAALYANTTGLQNTAVGRLALRFNTTASFNAAVGHGALYTNTTGANNVAMGYHALLSNTTASNNNAFGYQAGYNNTTGTQNTAVGSYALYANTTGGYNVAIGYSAMIDAASATDYNIAVGFGAGRGIKSGSGNNIAIGSSAMPYTANATNGGHICIGQNSGSSLTSSYLNVFIGAEAGYSNTTGIYNTYIGARYPAAGEGSGYYMTTGSGNIILGGYNGNQDSLDIRTSSYQTVIGRGINGWGARLDGGSSGNSWYQRSNSSSWATTSDRRIKTNFQPVTNGLEIINALKPTEFDYILTGQHDVSFIAQEYEEVLPDQVVEDTSNRDKDMLALTNGEPLKVLRKNLDPYLVSAIQALTEQVNQLKAEIATLKGA